MQDDLTSLFAYNRWADGRIVEAIKGLSAEQYTSEPVPGWPSIRTTLVHLGDAADIWSRRLAGEIVTVRSTEADYPTSKGPRISSRGARMPLIAGWPRRLPRGSNDRSTIGI